MSKRELWVVERVHPEGAWVARESRPPAFYDRDELPHDETDERKRYSLMDPDGENARALVDNNEQVDALREALDAQGE